MVTALFLVGRPLWKPREIIAGGFGLQTSNPIVFVHQYVRSHIRVMFPCVRPVCQRGTHLGHDLLIIPLFVRYFIK